MKSKFSFFTTALLVVMLCSSCYSKQGTISELEDFVLELKENGDKYTENDWDKAGDKYFKIMRQLHRYKYSNEEENKIAHLRWDCICLISKSCKNFSEIHHRIDLQSMDNKRNKMIWERLHEHEKNNWVQITFIKDFPPRIILTDSGYY